MRRFNPFDNSGMTLIEALLACVIVAVIILSVGMTLAHSIGVQRGAERYAYANNLAREKLESIKNLPYTDIAAGSTTETTPDNQYTIVTTITANMLPNGYPERTKTIRVQIYEGTGISAASLTLMADHSTKIHMRGL